MSSAAHKAPAAIGAPPAPCQESGCSSLATAKAYCRLHYMKNWKAIKARERKAARKRMAFEEELIHKVPVDYEEREPLRQRPLDIEMARAREDVEDMFREMGFEEDI